MAFDNEDSRSDSEASNKTTTATRKCICGGASVTFGGGAAVLNVAFPTAAEFPDQPQDAGDDAIHWGRLVIEPVRSVPLSVPTRIYENLAEEIFDTIAAWRENDLALWDFPAQEGVKILRIDGTSAEDVVDAKRSLQEILHGVPLTKNGEAIWTRSRWRHITVDFDLIDDRLLITGSEADAITAKEIIDGKWTARGDTGNCGRTFSLAELEEYLTPASLEAVLKAFFTAYAIRSASELKYCPTPDCEYLYRATSTLEDDVDSPVFSCPGCLAKMGTSCHVVHEDISCVQQRDLASGWHEAFRRAKEEMGLKDCPKCGITIERVAGCNHIEWTDLFSSISSFHVTGREVDVKSDMDGLGLPKYKN
ncbi:hypothetical protein GE09DRAFT_1180594 [Coniochaeta sp. 2T2.1]|nr:hypothetical protein GE09DRAFT_1180594 [Coniochaeta sp. 2T2.1]